MLANICYKFSTFADYSNITYSAENIKKMMDVFDDGDFVPGMVNQIAPEARMPQRLQLASADQLRTITILNERIDIEVYSDRKSGFAEADVPIIQSFMAESIRKIYEVFEENIPDAYRLGCNVDYVYFEITPEEMMTFRNRFLKDTSFYEKYATDEFIARFAGKVDGALAGKEEWYNALTTIERLFSTPGIGYQVEGYKTRFDINTNQANRKNRFAGEVFREFINCAYNIQKHLEGDFFDGIQ